VTNRDFHMSNRTRQDWIDQARAVRIESEIATRGIRLMGRGRDRCGPCPRCGGTDRFAINISKQVFLCRGCDRAGDVIELVRFLDDCDFNTACETLTRQERPTSLPRPRPAPGLGRPALPPADNTSRALSLWREAQPIAGTIALSYLAFERLIVELPPDVNEVLRFHPHCPYSGEHHPCLIALWRTIDGDKPIAIHRRPLSATGEKLDVWKALGPVAGAAIKLSSDDDVTMGLHVGEGVETTLAGMQLGFVPAWALGSAGGIERFPVLAGIDALTIFVDRDDAGMAAARICSERWATEEREVFLANPPIDELSDLNDLLKGSANDRVA
jgi:hypothetical protein